jgi:hypothetical protein
MANTATVKVLMSTHDPLPRLGATRRQGADQVILAALAAMERDECRQVAAAEAHAIKDEPQNLTEINVIRQDRAPLRAR